MPAVTVKINGLEKLRQKVSPQLIHGPMRDFLNSAAITVQGRGRENAPVDTGRLRSSIATQVDGSRPPLWAKVYSNVFYAPFQEFGTRFIAPRRFLGRAIEDSGADIRRLLDDMAKAIKQEWGR